MNHINALNCVGKEENISVEDLSNSHQVSSHILEVICRNANTTKSQIYKTSMTIKQIRNAIKEIEKTITLKENHSKFYSRVVSIILKKTKTSIHDLLKSCKQGKFKRYIHLFTAIERRALRKGQTYPARVLANIRQLSPSNSPTYESLMRLIKRLARLDRESFISELEHLPFISQADRFDICQGFLKHTPELLYAHIEKFQLDDQQLFEIALKLIDGDERNFLEHFSKFNFFNQEYLYQLALYLAKVAAEALCENFEKFAKLTAHQRTKIAEILVRIKPIFLCENFEKFHIHNQDDLYRLVLKILKNDDLFLKENFEKFEFTKQKYLNHLAILLAEKDPCWFVENLKVFNLTDSELALKIAVIIAEKDFDEFFSFIKGIAIPLKKESIEKIILKAAIANPAALSRNIKEIRADFSEKLAKLIAKKGGPISEHIHAFSFADPLKKIEIAKIAARKDSNFANYFSNFHITEEIRCKQLAEIAFENYPTEAIAHFNEFAIQEEENRLFFLR